MAGGYVYRANRPNTWLALTKPQVMYLLLTLSCPHMAVAHFESPRGRQSASLPNRLWSCFIIFAHQTLASLSVS